MGSYLFSHLADQTLDRDLPARIAREFADTATTLAYLGEFDARRRYLPAGYPSMYAYCVDKLHLSEECASKRICAARTARKFPAIFEALADGRLHLTAVVMLAPHLTSQNADPLLAGSAYKTKSAIRELLAEWFPQLDMPALVRPITSTSPGGLPDLDPVGPERVVPDLDPVGRPTTERVAPDLDPVEPPASERVVPDLDPVGPRSRPSGAPRPKVTPLAPERFALQVTIGRTAYDNLRTAQALLGHAARPDEAEVVERALEALVRHLEKRKFAATDRPRRPGNRRPTSSQRHIPAHVRRAVRERDGGRCTFTSDVGHRCEARTPLDYDHIEPVARGGRSTADNLRLRCRAHNQFEAERTFGVEFMKHKREAAQQARKETRRELEEAQRVAEAARAQADEARAKAEEVILGSHHSGRMHGLPERASAGPHALP